MEQKISHIENPENQINQKDYHDRLSWFIDGLARQLGGQELADKLHKQNEQYAQDPSAYLENLEEQALDYLAQKVGGKELADRLKKDREEFARKEKEVN